MGADSAPRGLLTYYVMVGNGLAPKFASEIRVRVPNFALKNIGDNYPFEFQIRSQNLCGVLL